jgi:hypothetical protein
MSDPRTSPAVAMSTTAATCARSDDGDERTAASSTNHVVAPMPSSPARPANGSTTNATPT